MCGDSLTLLGELHSQSVNCCVTSPPYYGLRDYGVEGQMGLEETPEEYVANMTRLFAEVRRVLRDDGVLWLNIGDSYAANRTYQVHNNKGAGAHTYGKGSKVPPGLKPKDLIGIPWMLAFALRAEGWYLRSDVIWQKPNGMPESIKDRPTRSHEYVFLLSKSESYQYDYKAISTPLKEVSKKRSRRGRNEDVPAAPGQKPQGGASMRAHPHEDKQAGHGRRHAGFNERYDAAEAAGTAPQTANARDVWTIAPATFRGAHFATMPLELASRCILSGCPAGGTVLDPFGGAGTTGLAAQMLGRNALLLELNPEYVKIAEDRLSAHAAGVAA